MFSPILRDRWVFAGQGTLVSSVLSALIPNVVLFIAVRGHASYDASD